MEPFTRLGRLVSELWGAKNFDERRFPGVATRCLEELKLHESFSPSELYRDFMLQHPAFDQKDGSFGQPPIVVFRGRGFHVEVLTWLSSSTEIHEHWFSGAFQVLVGSSIHAQYDFIPGHRVNSGLLLGDVRFRSHEHLGTGDIRPIVAGSSFIHALFHLHHPSVSLVVRTEREHDRMPQRVYQPPFLALDGHKEDRVRERRRQLTETLLETDPKLLESIVEASVTALDLESVYHLLSTLSLDDRSWPAVPKWIELGRERHGELMDYILPVLQEQRRMSTIRYCRGQISDPELRHFLALLLNIRSRDGILAAIESEFAGEPRSLLSEWLARLVLRDDRTVSFLGIDLEPISPAHIEPVAKLVLESARGMTEGLTGEGLVRRVASSLGPELVTSFAEEMRAIHDTFASPCFALSPMFSRA